MRATAQLGRLRVVATRAHIREQDATQKWAEVIERRALAVLDGTAELVDGKAALERVRSRLKNRGE